MITCEFNNATIKTIDVGAVIKKHSNLNEITQLNNPDIFSKVNIGMFGEIYWKNIITSTHNGEDSLWDYDLSPEFIFENAL